LMLVLLVGSAAFAIDISMWHMRQTREQKGADAAALAGAVDYPSDPAGADASAIDIARQNGYPVGAASTFGANGSCNLAGVATLRICTGPGDRPDQYKVTVAQKVDNLLGGIFGINTTVVKATATGEYLRPLVMGSPSNQFGDDPDASVSLRTYPNFWANIAGGNSTKTNGDAYAADNCNTTTDGCSASGFGNNLDFNPQGYFYSVTATSAGPVDLQAFDPGFVDVGDFCTNTGANNLLAASNLASVPAYPEGTGNTADIQKRYLPVTTQGNQNDPGYHYCTGDQLFGSGPPPVTTYQVLKASVPGDPTSATQVCSPITYPGFSGNLAAALGGGVTVPGAPAQLATYFRQWVSLCTVDAQAGDNFFIEVSTDSQSAGHNRFALRGVVPNSNNPAAVDVAGNAYMGIYANVGARLTQFYLARVPSAAAGHTLVLNFFDIGDASSVGTLQVAPPADSNVGSSFSNCQWTGSSGFALDTPTAPWGNPGVLPACTITGVNDGTSTWNGQWITVTIQLPANYTCADNDPNGCWVTINYNFAGGVNDTTSWNAFLIGDPVRLVK
jgi:Putative Flp pilus-assembly TadE/G-like